MVSEKIKLNEVEYAWPKRPVVVVCIDGGDPEYITKALRMESFQTLRIS